MEENIKHTKDENVPVAGTLEKNYREESSAVNKANPDGRSETNVEKKAASASAAPPQAEDKIFRMAFRCFTDEALSLLEVPGTPTEVLATEVTHLEWAYKAADFNVRMEDASVNHFQFQSKNGGAEDLRRFRATESLLSYQYKTPVVTNVIFSGTIRMPMQELKEGINTYRIRPIMMKGHDADALLTEMKVKVENGKALTKDDLLNLALTPLMDGKTPIKERILEAFLLIQGKTVATEEDVCNSDTILYTFAARFLEGEDLEEVKEAFDMTKLGEMLVEAAVKRTTEKVTRQVTKEVTEGVKADAAKSFPHLLDEKIIAERLELPLEYVRELKARSNAEEPVAIK